MAFTVLPENSRLIPESGCGQGPRKKGISANVLFPMQKIQAGCIIGKNSGYTKIRRKIRQQEIPKIDSRFLHIELLSREAWTSKDTKFFTPSIQDTEAPTNSIPNAYRALMALAYSSASPRLTTGAYT